jgi:N4-gp56 family major capsid protein
VESGASSAAAKPHPHQEIPMAQTSYAVNNALTVKLWAKKLAVEALKETMFGKFVGTTSSSLVQIKDETQKSAGDTITYGLRMQLSGAGVQGDGTLEGNEEALTTYSDAVVLNQLRHAVRVSGRMSQQRVPFDIRDESLSGLRDWWADRMDLAFFNQICGNLGPIRLPNGTYAANSTLYTGNNAALAPDSGHYLNAFSTTSVLDTDLTSANTFTLALIDRCVERAKTLTPAIRPLKMNGKEYYVMFLHPYAVTDMRTNTNTGQFLDIQKAAMTGGVTTDNPIFTGALGMYNNVLLFEDARVSAGYNASTFAGITTVSRNVFCGAQAAMLGFGRDNSPEKFTWVEELFDYENELGVSAGTIFGLKKAQFNNTDFGTIVASSYAASH